MNLQELLEKRAQIVAKMRDILDIADSENRGITEEEVTTH